LSAIHDLIGQISDPRLRERLAAEWRAASTGKKFGLVFEDHLPELLALPRAKPRRGDLVCRRQGPLKEVWQVKSVKDGMVTAVRPQDETHPSEPTRATAETVSFAVDEVMVVREFGEPIFPALTPVDAVQNGDPAGPWHTLIEADNYHALQLLEYLYAGKVDCIYIDPPYNTGARDWKYNNDYVDGNDSWRHSKWLAFMERRLKLAKRLLNPAASVLIVTIDEKEVLRLGILLEQVFPGCKVQKTTIVINPKGTARYNEFARVEEYAFFVFIGDIKICPFGSDLLTSRNYSRETHVRWRGLARTGRKGLRSNNPGSWYPIFLRTSDYTIHSIGDPLPDGEVESSVKPPRGTIAIWPPSKNGKQYSWGTVPTTLRQIWSKGGFKTGIVKPERQQFPFYYLSSGLFQKIENGQISVIGRGSQNELLLEYAEGQKQAMPRSVWNRVEYDAGSHGTGVLQSILGDSSFPFPKSLYAVRDSIRLFMEKRKDALILDFFAGSGTTLNAVNLLNAADGGQRRCILVTNNEVSAEEASVLSARGLQPGDDEWEAQGICRSVTWPRSKFTILGRRDDGTLLSGEYLTGKVVEKEKPRRFVHIGFVDPASLDTPAKKKQVVALIDGLPQTLVKDPCPFIVSEEHKASILFDPAAADDWLEALDGQEHITDFYIVTPAKRVFDHLKAQINDLLGPLLVPEDEKRPMSAGFAANLAYFKLDFLDKDRVTLKRAFREILPLLWLKAGAVGPRPELARGEPEPVVFAPAGSNFVVLLEESRLARLLKALNGREGLSHVFIVTDSDESFKAMAAEVREAAGRSNPGLNVVQLYRDYLVNFMINKRQDSASRAGLGAMPGAQA
jgi:adenine-specific DNA-methyltransferase